MIGVIGKNGAGKSTFLEILMTIKQYDAGTVVLFDEDILSLSTNRMEQLRKQISVVLQPTQFYKTLKVEELLKLFKALLQVAARHQNDHRRLQIGTASQKVLRQTFRRLEANRQSGNRLFIRTETTHSR